MGCTIYIDFREERLASHLQNLVNKHECDVQFVMKNLEVGDVIIHHEDPKLQLVFERKSVADLAASIKDGRYKEQKCRLMSTFPPKTVTYLIEGGHVLMNSSFGLSESVYDGIISHTMYRDGVHMVFTRDVSESALWIWKIANKVGVNPQKFVGTTDAPSCDEYMLSLKVKTRKIENITPSMCYTLQLCQIPGVSQKIAQNIVSVYPTMKHLMLELSAKEEKDIVHKLSQIPLIGKKKAEVIAEYLFKE